MSIAAKGSGVAVYNILVKNIVLVNSLYAARYKYVVYTYKTPYFDEKFHPVGPVQATSAMRVTSSTRT